MSCEICKGEMEERQATATKPYAYKLSGMEHVWLVGIRVRRCEKCNLELPTIPRIAELHRVIALKLIQKPGLLHGDEIRFLRKQAGFQARDFAALLGIRPEHLSRVETGRRESLGEPADRLARAVSVIARDGEAARAMLLDVASTLQRAKAQKQRPKEKPPVFTLLKGGRWLKAA